MTQVLIVGGGITGLSTAYHLKQLGVTELIVIDDPAEQSTSQACAGFVLGSLFDNITRLAHAYGSSFAGQIYRFSQQALHNLADFCRQHQILFATAEHRRLIVSATEKIEAGKAVNLFREEGFAAQLLPVDDKIYNGEQVYAVQNDAIGGGYVDLKKLFATLRQLVTPVRGRVTALNNDSTVITDNCGKLTSELIVAAGHHRIVELIDGFRGVIIPYRDQWSVFQLTTAVKFLRRGQIYTANHGHEWAVVADNDILHIGGARFLRRLAGIGDTEPYADDKISNYLSQRFAEYLPSLKMQLLATTALIGVRPCDELPIIGPMYGNDRLLLAGGYMGNGLSWGFQAGKCLAELIVNGQSVTLPRQLWPERLRSIA